MVKRRSRKSALSAVEGRISSSSAVEMNVVEMRIEIYTTSAFVTRKTLRKRRLLFYRQRVIQQVHCK